MNREEFQKELSSRFQSTESGFGSMTQRELILLQIASNLYESEVKKFRLGDVVGRSEQLVCDCGNSSMTWYGNDDDKKWFCFNCKKEAN